MSISMTQPAYVYCIARCAEARAFERRAIGNGGVVHTVYARNIAAVVSDSPVPEYDSNRRNMLAHTLVLEEVMAQYPMLPVRFGIVAPSERAVVEQVLERRYDELNKLLYDAEGRIELGLKAIWHDTIFREVADAQPGIADLRASIAGRPEAATHFQRIKLGELVSQALERRRIADAERILARLRPLVLKTRTNQLITDRMVLNAAFLLDHTREAAFDAAVQSLDAELGAQMTLKYVGPVPPYNFVNITITWD